MRTLLLRVLCLSFAVVVYYGWLLAHAIRASLRETAYEGCEL